MATVIGQDKQGTSGRDEILRSVDSKGQVVEYTVGELQDLGIISRSDSNVQNRGKKYDIGPSHSEWGEKVDFGV